MAEKEPEIALKMHNEHQPRVELNVEQAKAFQRGEVDKAIPAASPGMDMDLPEPQIESPYATPTAPKLTDQIRQRALSPSAPGKGKERDRER